MKKIAVLAMAAVFTFSFTACKKSEPLQPAASKSAEQSASAEQVISGAIQDASMNTLTIAVEGKNLTFSTMDADKSKAKGLITGSNATVYYTGSINGDDTSGATVIRVEQ